MPMENKMSLENNVSIKIQDVDWNKDLGWYNMLVQIGCRLKYKMLIENKMSIVKLDVGC